MILTYGTIPAIRMFRTLIPEYAAPNPVSRESRPVRIHFPNILFIGRHSGRWRDFPSNDATDGLLRGRLTRGKRKPEQAQREFVINDQTFPAFLKNLRIRLPTWHPKTLDEELRTLHEHEEAKRTRGGRGG